ncbi:MAG: response regulator [Pseudomonadales bacterium]|nr:response regulator [Pseudomonadales bacterium]
MVTASEFNKSLDQALDLLASGELDNIGFSDEAYDSAQTNTIEKLKKVQDRFYDVIEQNSAFDRGQTSISISSNSRTDQVHQSYSAMSDVRRVFVANMKDIAVGKFNSLNVAKGIDSEFGSAFNDIVTNMLGTIEQARQIAKGNYEAEITPNSSQDELGNALYLMTESLRDVGQVAEALAVGDFTRKVKVKGDKDLLATSINTMIDRLQQNQQKFESEVWLKAGQTQLLESMRGDLDLDTLTDNVVTFISKYTESQVGVFYLADTDGSLSLSSSYAYRRRKNLSNKIAIGEGIVGQSVKEKQILSISNVPEDYICINSGLGEAPPRYIIVVPFLHDGSVKGALELGSFNAFSDNTLQLLENVSGAVAIAISSAHDKIKVKSLLEEMQHSNEETQTQAEEILESNKELERQNKRVLQSESELKTQQESLQSANEELEEKTQYLEQQKASIQAKNNEIEKSRALLTDKARDLELSSRYKSEFLANMSHELRTPLNSLLILSQTLHENKDGNLTEHQQESASIIHNGGVELLNLINDILDLSKVESGKMTLCIETVETRKIAENLENNFEPLARNKEFRFSVDVAENIPKTFLTDKQRTIQILKNLLSNAFKFTQQGAVTLTVAKPALDTRFKQAHLNPQNCIGFSVEDTGLGIESESQRMIFEAFQQADGSTSRDFGGTGLGLTISRELCRLLGSELQIYSVSQQGSTFTLYMPIENDGLHGDREKSAASVISFVDSVKPTAREHPLSFQRVSPHAHQSVNLTEYTAPVWVPDDRDKITLDDKSILIVEDDRDFACVLMGIAKHKEYLCIVAGDGKSALHMAAQYKPSAILLDLGLPDIDGLKVLDILKEDLTTRHIPIHVISGRSEVGNLMNLGAIGYLQKPTSAGEVDKVFKLIDRYVDKHLKSLLIVEDDETYSNTLKGLLQTDDLKVDQANSGEETLLLMAANNYDCVIMDLSLPDTTGEALIKELKQREGYLPPIIVNTGKELSEIEYKKIAKDSHEVVIKGINSTERLLDEVALFLHQSDATLTDRQRKAVKLLHDDDRVLKGHTVLLVDDDLRNIFALSAVLENSGLKVVTAENGQEALDLLETNKEIELVLMDIMMPVMDGYEAIRKIRLEEQYKTLPVIALTAKAMAEDRNKCIEVGANDYMNKPVDTGQLLSLLKVTLFDSPRAGY